MEDQGTQYVRGQLQMGALPTQIVQNLVNSGWNQTQAIQLVQHVSGVQIALNAAPGGYAKPPLILQIMYGLSFFLLLFGILAGVGAVTSFTNRHVERLGESSTTTLLNLFAFLLSAVLIAYFFVIREMRNGKLGALKIYSGLLVLSLVASFTVAIYSDKRSALLGNSASNIATILTTTIAKNAIPALLCLYIWKKHRAYFR